MIRQLPYCDSLCTDDAGNGVATAQDYDWCDQCNEAFVGSDSAAQLGIYSNSSFHIRGYLAKTKVRLGNNASALVLDPILHAYSLNTYLTQAEVFAKIRADANQAAANLGNDLAPIVCGNAWGFWGQSPASTLISQRTDVVWAESSSLQPVPSWAPLWTDPPPMNSWSVLLYKIGLASGDGKRPTWIFANDCNNPALSELWLSEGIANGGLAQMLHIDPPSSPGSPGFNASAPFQQVNARHAGFVAAPGHRWLFVDRRSAADVALVLSLPSMLWRDFSSLTFSLGGYNETHMNYISVIGRVLSDRHVPFDVIILGYPLYGLYDDSEQLAKLATYNTVILPMVDSMSDAHIAALRHYASASAPRSNTLVVVSPDRTGTLDEDLKPRTGANGASIFEGVPYITVEHTAAQKYYRQSNQSIGDEIYNQIFSPAGLRPAQANTSLTKTTRLPLVLTMDGPSTTWVGGVFAHGNGTGNAMRSTTLVNYELLLSGPKWHALQPRNSTEHCGMCGEFTEARNITLALRCPLVTGTCDCTGWEGTSARFFAVEAVSTTKPGIAGAGAGIALDMMLDHAKGVANVVVRFVRTLAVVVIGAEPGEIDARAAAAVVRYEVNRAIVQARSVSKAGAQVIHALHMLQGIHNTTAPQPLQYRIQHSPKCCKAMPQCCQSLCQAAPQPWK